MMLTKILNTPSIQLAIGLTALLIPAAADTLGVPIIDDPDIPYIDVDASCPTMEPVEDRIRALFGDPGPWRQFLTDFQSAVAAGDAAQVAAMVEYPLNVYTKDEDLLIHTPEEFVEQYPDLFDERMLSVIENQTFDGLFVRDQGCMIGRGEVWFGVFEVEESDAIDVSDWDSGIIRLMSMKEGAYNSANF